MLILALEAFQVKDAEGNRFSGRSPRLGQCGGTLKRSFDCGAIPA